MAAARIVGTDSLVADPATGRFMGSKRELLVRRILTLTLSRWEWRRRAFDCWSSGVANPAAGRFRGEATNAFVH